MDHGLSFFFFFLCPIGIATHTFPDWAGPPTPPFLWGLWGNLWLGDDRGGCAPVDGVYRVLDFPLVGFWLWLCCLRTASFGNSFAMVDGRLGLLWLLVLWVAVELVVFHTNRHLGN